MDDRLAWMWRCRVCGTSKVVPNLARDCEARCCAGLGVTIEEFLERAGRTH